MINLRNNWTLPKNNSILNVAYTFDHHEFTITFEAAIVQTTTWLRTVTFT